MSSRQTNSSRLPTKALQLSLQPPLAWIAILGLVSFSALCLLAGAGKLLNLAFPLGSLAVGALLYFRYPTIYISFTWWIWFLTPLVRRLADYRSKFTDPSPILLAPFLVTLVTFCTLWQHLPKSHRQGSLPFVVSLIAILYGFLVGLIYRTPIKVGISLLDWLVPVLFGFHLFVNWQNYPSYRQTIQRTFLWGVLVMGIYGVIQFLVLPEWDRYWLIQSEFSSGGKPEPLMINVWSTMASNRPFGTVMMAGLLLLFTNKNQGLFGIPTTLFGYLAFLLTRKRTTWASWFLGLLTLTSSLNAKLHMRLIISIIITVLCIIPLTTIEPFSGFINSRLETFFNLEDDNSAEARQEIFNNTIDDALNSFLGSGIGGLSLDSGILSTLLDLGWFGTILYLSGILTLMFSLFQSPEIRSDQFASAARAIAFATLIQIPLGRPHLEVQGVILWGFLGIGMAAKKYYQYQLNSESKQSLPQNHPQHQPELKSTVKFRL